MVSTGAITPAGENHCHIQSCGAFTAWISADEKFMGAVFGDMGYAESYHEKNRYAMNKTIKMYILYSHCQNEYFLSVFIQ